MLNRLKAWTIHRDRALVFKRTFDLEGPRASDAERVLAYLRDFCGAEKTTLGATPEETHVLIGRREVWLKITEFLNFDERTVRELTETHDDHFGFE